MGSLVLYVESNFVLELALLQQEHSACEEILTICKTKKVRLIIPSFSISEPYHTINNRKADRTNLANSLGNTLTELSRTSSYKQNIMLWQQQISFLTQTIEEDAHRLQTIMEDILNLCEIIQLDKTIIEESKKYRSILKDKDSIIYASVLEHLKTGREKEKIFIARDGDFHTEEIKKTLMSFNCKILYKFTDGLNYIKHKIS